MTDSSTSLASPSPPQSSATDNSSVNDNPLYSTPFSSSHNKQHSSQEQQQQQQEEEEEIGQQNQQLQHQHSLNDSSPIPQPVISQLHTTNSHSSNDKNSNKHNNTRFLFEESDAEILEIGLLEDEVAQYINNNNTPCSIQPSLQPINSNGIPIYPPSIDLDQAQVETGNNHNNDESDDGDIIDSSHNNGMQTRGHNYGGYWYSHTNYTVTDNSSSANDSNSNNNALHPSSDNSNDADVCDTKTGVSGVTATTITSSPIGANLVENDPAPTNDNRTSTDVVINDSTIGIPENKHTDDDKDNLFISMGTVMTRQLTDDSTTARGVSSVAVYKVNDHDDVYRHQCGTNSDKNKSPNTPRMHHGSNTISTSMKSPTINTTPCETAYVSPTVDTTASDTTFPTGDVDTTTDDNVTTTTTTITDIITSNNSRNMNQNHQNQNISTILFESPKAIKKSFLPSFNEKEESTHNEKDLDLNDDNDVTFDHDDNSNNNDYNKNKTFTFTKIQKQYQRGEQTQQSNDDKNNMNDGRTNNVAENDNTDVSTTTTTATSITSFTSQLAQSKSYHRRLHETAQFAEAIGEVPQDGMIQVIIDDDDDDDSDDEQNNDENENIIGSVNIHDIKENDDDGNVNLQQDPIVDVVDVVDDKNNLVMDEPEQDDELNGRTSSLVSSTAVRIASAASAASSASTTVAVDIPIEEDQNKNLTPKISCEFHNDDDNKGSNIDEISSPIPKHQEQQIDPQHQIPLPSLQYQPINYFMHRLPCKSPIDKPTRTSSLTSNTSKSHYEYKGIQHNPPEITKRGLSRGNYAQLHRKAWLEVSDKYHRYGKNLRLYYKYWESLDHPTNMFFEWLDSKGEAAGWTKPNLTECPRSVLDSDRVMYISDSEQQQEHNRYILKIKTQVTSLESGSESTPKLIAHIVNHNGDVVRTGPNGWIFVLRDHELYGAEKVTKSHGKVKLRFHHSSFFAGKAVAAAGILITNENGCLKRLYPHSGHYRPGEAHMQRMLFYLYQRGVDLDSFEVDMQQIMHVSREIRDKRTPKGGNCEENTKKARKTDSLHLKTATFVALFLAHKAKQIRLGVLSRIHKIRSIHSSKRSVRNVLNVVDDGGYWPVRNVQ